MGGYLTTELQAINNLMGGIPVGTMCGLCGAHEAGKTIITIQFAMEAMKVRGGNALILDTEGSGYTYTDWVEKLNARYGMEAEVVPVTLNLKESKSGTSLELKPDKKVDNHAIYVLDERNLQTILKLLGRGCNFINSDTSGRFSIKIDSETWEDDVRETPVGKFIGKHSVTYMAMDSISYPFLEFGNQRENFPARSQATGWLMGALQQLANRFNLIQFGVMHQSIDDQDIYSRPKVLGGKNVSHSYKFIMYINREQSTHTPPAWKKRPKTVRELRLLRHPSRAPWERAVYMNLTHEGMIDIEPPESGIGGGDS